MAITFCVRQHAMFLFNTKLDTINNVKGVSNLKINERKPQITFNSQRQKSLVFGAP